MPHCCPCEKLEKWETSADSLIFLYPLCTQSCLLNVVGIYNTDIMISNLRPYIDSKLIFTEQNYMKVFDQGWDTGSEISGTEDCVFSLLLPTFCSLLCNAGWENTNYTSQNPLLSLYVLLGRGAVLRDKAGRRKEYFWFGLRVNTGWAEAARSSVSASGNSTPGSTGPCRESTSQSGILFSDPTPLPPSQFSSLLSSLFTIFIFNHLP